MRKMTVHVLAGVIVVILAGASLAASAADSVVDDVGEGAAVPAELPAPAELPTPVETPAPATSTPSEAVGALVAPPDPPEEAEDQDREGFGALRSAEARRFGACMEAAGEDQDAKRACRDLRPGPAHLHPDHPGRSGGEGPGRSAEARAAAPGQARRADARG